MSATMWVVTFSCAPTPCRSLEITCLLTTCLLSLSTALKESCLLLPSPSTALRNSTRGFKYCSVSKKMHYFFATSSDPACRSIIATMLCKSKRHFPMSGGKGELWSIIICITSILLLNTECGEREREGEVKRERDGGREGERDPLGIGVEISSAFWSG